MGNADPSLMNALVGFASIASGAIGILIKTYVDKNAREATDMAALKEKIRSMWDELGMPYEDLKTLDDMFKAVRSLQLKIKEMKCGKSSQE